MITRTIALKWLPALVLAAMLAVPAHAAVVWNDGDAVNDNWSDGDNWVGGSAPGAGGSATFDGTGPSPATVDTAQSVDHLTFSNGPFTIDGASTLTVGGNWAVLDASTYTVSAPITDNGSSTTYNVATGGTLDIQNLAGKDGGVDGYTKTGGGKLILDDNLGGAQHTVTVNAGTLELNPSGTTALNSLTVGKESTVDSATADLQAALPVALTVRNTGTVNFGSFNQQFGSDLTMSGGTINIASGQKLDMNGMNVTWTYEATTDGGQATIAGPGTIDVTGLGHRRYAVADNASVDQDWVITAALTGNDDNVNVEKTGAGTLVFAGNNTYSGIPTDVLAGTLLVNGTTSGQGTYTVADGATLGGTGTIDAPVVANAGGILAPGASVGTLNVTNNDVSLIDAIFAIELDAAQADLLSVDAGALDLTGADVTAPTMSEYLIATATGGVTLGSTTVTGDGAWTLELRTNDTELYLVPEPGTIALLSLGGLGVLLRRRRG